MSHLQIIRIWSLFPDLQATQKQQFCFLILALLDIKAPQIGECSSHLKVVRPPVHFTDSQGKLTDFLRFLIPALLAVNGCQTTEHRCYVEVLRAKKRFSNVPRFLVEGFGFPKLASRLQIPADLVR